MTPATLLDRQAMNEIIGRLAREVVDGFPEIANLAVIGVHTRGVILANRLVNEIYGLTKKQVLTGTVDITFYRDDLATRGKLPELKETRIDFDMTGKDILLVDDVLFTGRSIKAAMETVMSFGRPNKIKLLVMVDRGNRDLPIQPDFAGYHVDTEASDSVEVNFIEIDEIGDAVMLLKK